MGAKANWNTLPEQLLDLAKQAGAEAAEVFQSSSSARPVFFEANRLKQLETNQLEGTALRLWRDGRPGIAVAHGPIEPQALVDKAIAISQLNASEAIELSEGTARRYPDMGAEVPVAQMIQWGEAAIARTSACSRPPPPTTRTSAWIVSPPASPAGFVAVPPVRVRAFEGDVLSAMVVKSRSFRGLSSGWRRRDGAAPCRACMPALNPTAARPAGARSIHGHLINC